MVLNGVSSHLQALLLLQPRIEAWLGRMGESSRLTHSYRCAQVPMAPLDIQKSVLFDTHMKFA